MTPIAANAIIRVRMRKRGKDMASPLARTASSLFRHRRPASQWGGPSVFGEVLWICLELTDRGRILWRIRSIDEMPNCLNDQFCLILAVSKKNRNVMNKAIHGAVVEFAHHAAGRIGRGNHGTAQRRRRLS